MINPIFQNDKQLRPPLTKSLRCRTTTQQRTRFQLFAIIIIYKRIALCLMVWDDQHLSTWISFAKRSRQSKIIQSRIARLMKKGRTSAMALNNSTKHPCATVCSDAELRR